jgi:hypothetical protein
MATKVKEKFDRLYRLNIAAAVLHAVSGLLVWLLSNETAVPVVTNFLTFNEQTETLQQANETLFDLPLGPLVAIFFFFSAAAHLYVATIGRDWYEKNLKNKINPARWYEYSFSASIMMVAISLLAGVYDLSSLLMIFMLTSIMNLMGLMMEVHNQTTKKTNWLSYNIGVIAGIVPWAVVAIYFIGSAVSGGGADTIPAFVYWIYVSIFLFFNSFAINMILQYREVGKWKDYLYGERAYIILSFVAKSALAWQIFGGTLGQPV